MAYQFQQLSNFTQPQGQPKQYSQNQVFGAIAQKNQNNQQVQQATAQNVQAPVVKQLDKAKTAFQTSMDAYKQQSAQNVAQYKPLDAELVRKAEQGDQDAYSKVRNTLTSAQLDPGAYVAPLIQASPELEQIRAGNTQGLLQNHGASSSASALDSRLFNAAPLLQNLDSQVSSLAGEQAKAMTDLTAQAKADQDAAITTQREDLKGQLSQYLKDLDQTARVIGQGKNKTADSEASTAQSAQAANILQAQQRIDQEQAEAERAVTAAAQAKMEEAAKQYGGPQTREDAFGRSFTATNPFYEQLQGTVKENVMKSLQNIRDKYGAIRQNLPSVQAKQAVEQSPYYDEAAAQNFNNISQLLGRTDMRQASQAPVIAQAAPIDIEDIIRRNLDPTVRASNAGDLVNSSKVYSTRNGKRI